MNRREFIALLGGAGTVWPVAAETQQPERMRRIGFILGASPPSQFGLGFLGGLAQGMRELGYVEGKDFVIEWRTALGDYSRFPAIAAELMRLKVDVFVLGTTAALPAVQQATSTIPIVITKSRLRRRPECHDRIPLGWRSIRSAAGAGGRSRSPTSGRTHRVRWRPYGAHREGRDRNHSDCEEVEWHKLDPQGRCHCLQRGELGDRRGQTRLPQHGHARDGRRDLFEQLQPFCG